MDLGSADLSNFISRHLLTNMLKAHKLDDVMTVFLHDLVLLKKELFCYLKRVFCSQETKASAKNRKRCVKEVISKMSIDAS